MSEFLAALREYRYATADFNHMGEPASGPVRDRLDAAVETFIRLQRREPADDEEDEAVS
ncbi:hypothetical protein [Nocardia brasiliensis]|uniref:hypothetical protein n=1 Tax=Nocardia brasiliensis TaxID=37326 RepID=UPI0024589DE8|nr:hypothetical protein [Nocardia brasiliensis]